jgi:hypothetical protein
MDAEKLRFVTTFIEYPEETALTEYKSAVGFESRSDFGAKLVKHILGQANVGGGYIVIGFQEDANGKLRPDSALTEEVSRSYETTRLSQSVDAVLGGGQRIELLVHKISLNGKVYPVISIQGFKASPYFCGRDYVGTNGTPILKQGAVYVRDAAAKTVVIAGPDRWNSILKHAVAVRHEDFLERLRSMLGQLGIEIPTPGSFPSKETQEQQRWYESESKSAYTLIETLHPGTGRYEVFHNPQGVSDAWDQAQLLAAAQKSVVRKTGWPIGLVMSRPEFAPRPTASGIRAIVDAQQLFDYWVLSKSGEFYLLRLLDEDSDNLFQNLGDTRWIYFDTRIWRIAETLLHCSTLYGSLGLLTDTPINIRIRHSGLKGRKLGVANRMRHMHWERHIHEESVEWSRTITLGSIESSLKDLTGEASRDLFVLFEFWQLTDQVFTEVFDEFAKSRV